MRHISITQNIIWVCLIIAASLIVILTAVFSLSNNINDIFPYFFLVPVILTAYAFPQRGILVTITLGWVYIVLVYVFGTISARIIALDTAWFFIFVSLGIVISYFAESSRAGKTQVEILKREAFQQIELNMEQLAILNDQIRNPLQAILLDTEMIDEEAKALISEQVTIIEKILDTLDEKYLESEKVRKFLHKHYSFEKKPSPVKEIPPISSDNVSLGRNLLSDEKNKIHH
jgi:glucose-6-phosphate-specific signal transduction histidine kinase